MISLGVLWKFFWNYRQIFRTFGNIKSKFFEDMQNVGEKIQEF